MLFDFKMADGTNREENASDVAVAGRKTNNNNRWRKLLEVQQAILANMSQAHQDPEIVFKLACEVLEKLVVCSEKIELK